MTERFSIDQYKRMLRIDKHALDDMHQAQPELLFDVSEQLTLAISRRDTAKMELAQAEAEADKAIREEARTAEKKITEKEVEAQVKMDDDVDAAQRTLLDLNQDVGILFGLKEAFVDRRNALDSITKLYMANYYDRKQQDRPSSGERDLRSAQAADSQAQQNRQRSERRVPERERPNR